MSIPSKSKCLFISWSLCLMMASAALFGQSKPNIIYILADDLGYGDVSAYNPESRIKTTNIDKLAAEGMIFTDAHSPSSVCTPTRYGILTGRYCWRSRLPKGVLRGYGRALIEDDRPTIAAFLQKHGYATSVVGKWHLGLDWVVKEGHEYALTDTSSLINDLGMVQEMDPVHIDFSQKPTNGPLNHGFQYSYILPASLDMDPYCYLENDVLIEEPTDYTPGNDLNTGYTEAFWRPGKKAPSFTFDQVLPNFCDRAVQFIDDHADGERPFFLYLPLAAPHTPWVPTTEFEGATDVGTYGDFVTMVDDAVGQILLALERSGNKDETLVIFTSDNGPFWTPELIEKYQHRSAGNLRGMKADAWEGGHRIPYIVRWPGQVAASTQSPALTSLTHLFATLAEVLQVPVPEGTAEDSYSILPVLLGKTKEVESQPAVIHHSSRGYYAIRKGDWKYIAGRGSGGFSLPRTYDPKPGEPTGQLYNLRQDPGEVENLFSKYPDKVRELTTLLASIRKEH